MGSFKQSQLDHVSTQRHQLEYPPNTYDLLVQIPDGFWKSGYSTLVQLQGGTLNFVLLTQTLRLMSYKVMIIL